MAKKASLTPVTNTVNNANEINNNLNAINDKLDNTLSIDGSTPNAMNADVDLNSNNILNTNVVYAQDIDIQGNSVNDLVDVAQSAAVSAQEAQAATEEAQAATEEAAAWFAYPDPYFLLWGGQSNAKGSDGGSGTDWITEAGKVYVYIPDSGLWADALGLQGSDPFNVNGSNCAGVHHAYKLAVELDVTVYMVLTVAGGTEISEWTGGGYASGVPITTDRTISDSNRVQFKKITDAVSTATNPTITQFHAGAWFQGESDADTPEDIYISELNYLYSEIKGAGLSPVASRVMPFSLYGLYTGLAATQQSLRSSSIEKAIRENPHTYMNVPTHDLAGVTGGVIINHLNSASLKEAGERGARTTKALIFGASGVLIDKRIEDLAIPAPEDILGTSFIGERLGYRGYLAKSLADTESYTLVIRDGQHARGEIYKLAGATTLELDGKINTLLNDNGRHFSFFQIVNSDTVTLNGNGRDIVMMNDGTVVPSMTITGAGQGWVEIRNNRYMVHWEPQIAHNDVILANGTHTVRQKYSPLQLRVSGLGSIASVVSVQTISTDSGVNIYSGTTVLYHNGTLTVDRTVTLFDTDRYDGEIVTISNVGAGAFDLVVRNHDTTLLRNVANTTSSRFAFNGTDWLYLH